MEEAIFSSYYETLESCALKSLSNSDGVGWYYGEKDGIRPFRFQAALLLHSEFNKWMEKEWVREGDLMRSLYRFSEKLSSWNKDTFGCIFERKRRVRRRLEGVLRALDQRPSLGLLKLEKKLKRE